MPGQFTFSSQVAPVCEVGMSDVTQAEPDSWVDISCYVHEAELVRGRERFSDRFQPGTATITFSNDTGWADLPGDYTTVESQMLRPGRPIRVGVQGPFDDGPVVTRWLWRGFIDQATPAYDPVLHDVVTVNCIDAFGEAGMRQLLGGPLVGVNEAVHLRIGRVLDARGWWSSKRNIATGTALMQGTTLAGSTSDLLTAPADSAGGVVYGDTDGNVAYKDFDWELYDPDLPADGEIGNCDPGQQPSEGTPPYIDPTAGTPPYDPDPPLPPHPTITHFCVGQNDAPDVNSGGVIIERGEAYTIFVNKPGILPEGTPFQPHLYLTENGHTWDLGEWPVEGGCTTITHPTDPTDAGGPPEPPTRTDDKTPTVIIPGIPVPPEDLWGVELLGYSDGGLADPPADTVTVTGITPGAGRLLIVLVCALCNDLTAGSLTPFPVAGGSITGGGVTFDEIGREPAGLNGAESYGAAGRTGRIDPGTFDVVVDWSGTNQSREHIVTVWGVRSERADMLERLQAGAFLRSFTWDRTTAPLPSPNPPGKGFWQTAFEDPSSDMAPYAPLRDITIAQTLAESPTPPFGATFNTVDGDWWTPAFAAGPALLSEGDICDEFDRADGPLGPGWIPPVPGAGYTAIAVTIDDEAAVCAADDGSNSDWGMVRTSGGADGAQFIEVEVTNAFQGTPELPVIDGFVELYAQMNDTGPGCLGMSVSFSLDEDGATIYWNVFVRRPDPFTDYIPVSGSVPVSLPAPPTVIRFEAEPDGTIRCLINGTEVAADTVVDPLVPNPTGPHVGFGLHWFQHGGGTSPRIERACTNISAGIVRKCSWVAGYRGPLDPAFPAPSDVKFDTVNLGPDNIQSCQACVVLEPLWPDQFGWRTLAYYAQAPTPPATVPPMSHSSTVRYERNSVIAVFVSAFAAVDMAAGITVTSSAGLAFTAARVQPKAALSHAQGVVFTAKTPELAVASDVITVAWAATLDGVNYLIEEVTNGDTVAATGSQVRGTHTLGSVDGGVSVVLSSAPATNSLTLGFLGVLGDPNESGATPGADFVEQVEYLPSGQRTYLQAQSRVLSTSNLVNWVDMNASSSGGPQASDAVAFAVAITPGSGYANWDTEGPLVLGGAGDAFGGPIYSAEDRDADGTIIWSFDPGDYV